MFFKSIKIMAVVLWLCSFGCIFGQSDCSILHRGTFLYDGNHGQIKVIISGNIHTEYHDSGKYFIKSDIEWVTDCEYNLTLKEVTIPNFPFGTGTVMNVKITKVDGKEVYYTATVNGKSWKGLYTKIE